MHAYSLLLAWFSRFVSFNCDVACIGQCIRRACFVDFLQRRGKMCMSARQKTAKRLNTRRV